eukprot:229348_1
MIMSQIIMKRSNRIILSGSFMLLVVWSIYWYYYLPSDTFEDIDDMVIPKKIPLHVRIRQNITRNFINASNLKSLLQLKTMNTVSNIDINTNLYPKYYYYDWLNATHYFENCVCFPASWAKSTQSHYFIQQLKENKFNKRVYECNEADLFIIPLSLGNALRGNCKTQVNKTQIGDRSLRSMLIQKEVNLVIQSLNKQLFTSPNSCWNKQAYSRTRHFIMLGDFKGRNYMIANKKNETQIFYYWNKYFLAADVDARDHNAIQRCLISSGHVSLWVGKFLNELKQSNNPLLLPSIDNNTSYIMSNISYISQWRNRKYDMFFMGQVDARRGYRMRHRLFEYYNSSTNNITGEKKIILIQTVYHKMKGGNLSHQYLNCNGVGVFRDDINTFDTFDEFYEMNVNNFPCSIQKWSPMLYVEGLKNSMFNLMFRGDDSCSSRFEDAIVVNVINIVVSDYFTDCLVGYDPSNMFIPWDKMFLWIPETTFTQNPQLAISNLLAQYTVQDFENMLRIIQMYKKHILWDYTDSQVGHNVLYNIMKKCKLDIMW